MWFGIACKNVTELCSDRVKGLTHLTMGCFRSAVSAFEWVM